LAKRPKYSILVNTKFEKLRPWRLALKEYLLERERRRVPFGYKK
jgi:dTDP-4-dehydrorhamnose reductase